MVFAANADPVGGDEAPNPLTCALAEAKLAAEAEARLVLALQVKSSQLAKSPQAPEPEAEPEPEPEVEVVDSPLVTAGHSCCLSSCSQSSLVVSADL